jgi:hypothetical protein
MPVFDSGEPLTLINSPVLGSYQRATVVPASLDMSSVIVRIVGMYAMSKRAVWSSRRRSITVGRYRAAAKRSRCAVAIDHKGVRLVWDEVVPFPHRKQVFHVAELDYPLCVENLEAPQRLAVELAIEEALP